MSKELLSALGRPVVIKVVEPDKNVRTLLDSSLAIGLRYQSSVAYVKPCDLVNTLGDDPSDVLIARYSQRCMSMNQIGLIRKRFPEVAIILLVAEDNWGRYQLLLHAGVNDVWTISRPSPVWMGRSIAKAINERHTEKKLIADVLKAANQLDRSRTDMAQLAHDLRGSIAAIGSLTELLLQTPLKKPQMELVDRQQATSFWMATLLNDILDFSKYESGQITLNVSSCFLVHELEQLRKIFEITSRAKGLEFDWQVDFKEVHCSLDVLKLKRVIQNLISNAIKYTEKGRIGAHFELIGGSLQICIQDSGIGLSERARESLFTPYWQEASVANSVQLGTGLGLSICREFLTLMGGEIRVESQLGEGSKFLVRLPVEVTETVSEKSQKESRAKLIGKKILIVDDDADNRFIAKRFLADLECEVFEADSGEQALDLMEQRDFDLVLMDSQLPGLNGFETTAEIRLRAEKSGKTQTLIVFYTGSSSLEDQQKANLVGADGFFTRTGRRSDLIHLVQNVFVQKESLPEAPSKSVA